MIVREISDPCPVDQKRRKRTREHCGAICDEHEGRKKKPYHGENQEEHRGHRESPPEGDAVRHEAADLIVAGGWIRLDDGERRAVTA